MQKTLLVFALFLTSHAQELTPSQVNKLHNYNHSLSGKMRHKRLLKKTAIVTKINAKKIAKKECDSEVYSSKLSLCSNRLIYTLYTEKGFVKIDALDGKLMQKCIK
jgi:uncharacterized membrane protein YkoI